MKLFPVIVNVNAAPPAFAEFGLSETISGTGFWGGGGGPPPEDPDPLLPQPTNETATSKEPSVPRRRKLKNGTVLRTEFIWQKEKQRRIVYHRSNTVFLA
jgi:hypothetical protein